MRLLETSRIVVSLDSGRFDDARIEEIARKLKPELLQLALSMFERRAKEILAEERDLNGEKFVFRVFEE